MKFRLRSLMLVVTLVTVAFGSVRAYRNHRRFCLAEAQFHRSCIGGYQKSVRLAGLPDAPYELSKLDRAQLDHLVRKDQVHERLAQAYQRAVWFPFERLWIDDSPAESSWAARPN